MNKNKADQQASPDQNTHSKYSMNRRAAKVIETTPDDHSLLVRCPFCYQPHIHAAPNEADPLRLRRAPCDQSRVYIIGEADQ